MRVYELAKELNISPAELKDRLTEFDIKINSNFQQVDEAAERKLRGENLGATDSHKDDGRRTGRRTKDSGGPGLTTIEIPEVITVKEFSVAINVTVIDIIRKLIGIGEMATINMAISTESAVVLGEELGYEVVIAEPEDEEELDLEGPEGPPMPRPPVVTVMGHVDHGKTSLLDAIRETEVTAGEAGGITQHIGAYQVSYKDHKITFIDTPGHEAFTQMRARGAKATDIVILLVAANDGVKAQTLEALDHAKAAKVPIIVAINKIDVEGANTDRVKQQLSEHALIPEDWGGDTVFVEVSAKQRTNIDEILEMINLVSEVEELTAPIEGKARGVVIEAQLERGRGPVASVLVQGGTLKVGDVIIAGTAMGKVRALVDDHGKHHPKAVPAQPVEILGLGEVPAAGDDFMVVGSEKQARQIVEDRAERADALRRGAAPTVHGLLERIREGEIEELRIIVKADVQGSVEALREAIEKVQREDVRVTVIHQGVGAVSESDVMLAAASQAIVIGFNVRPEPKAKVMAEKESVEVRMHTIIYKAVDDVRNASIGLLKPQMEEIEVGRVEVRDTFKVPKIGVIAGCYVVSGEINREDKIRLVRDGVLVHDGKLASLRRFKDDVPSVKTGYECGIGLVDFQDIKVGDVLDVYSHVEKARD